MEVGVEVQGFGDLLLVPSLYRLEPFVVQERRILEM